MLVSTLAFVAGIYCLMQFSYLPSPWLITLLPLLFFFIRFSPVFRFVLIFFIGFCWALLFSELKLAENLDGSIENTDVLITGNISSITETYDDHIRFLVDVDELTDLSGLSHSFSGVVRLSWYKHSAMPVPGDIWQLKVKLKKTYAFMNPGGFDYELWMLRQGVTATGYVKQDKQNKKIGVNNTYFIEKLRYKIADELKHKLEKPLLGLMLALSLGDRSELEVEQWKVLSQTGTNHLIAISGLHLSLVAGFIYILARFFWSRFHFLTQRVSSPLFASVMAFVAAFLYALLSGFALPAQRALIMIAVFLLAIFSAKQVRAINVICIALILVLTLDPFAVLAADFYLSFMAVIFILYISRFRINNHHKLIQWIRLQCLLSIALSPILIFWFKQVPLYGALANLIAIPIVGFLIVPLALIALILLFPLPAVSQSIYELIDKINQINWAYLEFLSEQTGAVIPISVSSVISFILAMIGILILTMPKGLPARYLGLFFLLPLLFPITEKLGQGEFEFVMLDVGQGLAAVIKTKEHVLVYDSGAKYSKRFNIGDAVIKPYLREMNIRQISMLLISHGDNDHIGGAKAVLENFTVDQVLTSVPTEFTDEYSKNLTKACHVGQQWYWDGVYFEILHPRLNKLYDGNNASCVLRVSSGKGSVLLTGDIEKEAEKSLVERYGGALEADILLVPHHGSKTSSNESFIAAVSPKYAFISAGYRNRFGFPKEDIIQRYDAHNVKTIVSYKTGEISAKFRDEGLQIDEFRTKNRRFWHH